MSATRGRAASWLRWAVLILIFLGIDGLQRSAHAEDDANEPEHRTESSRTVSTLSFVGGAAAGFLTHESGHVLFDVVFDANPGVRRVEFAGLPFFAVTHRAGLSHRREYTIGAAGFWLQSAVGEWVLTKRPGLRRESGAFAKGLLAWSVTSSAAYTAAAFGRFGPPERDTRGMAESLGVPEPVIGTMLLVPALCDVWRYIDPDARWPRWVSRAAKLVLVVVVIRARG